MSDIYTLLKQYDDLALERADISRRIGRLNDEIRALKGTIVSDSVEGTRPDGTYGSIRIEGIPMPEYDTRFAQLEKKRAQYAKIQDHLNEITELIDGEIMSVTDPSVRTIIRYRYIDKMKWETVARKMGMNASTCRMRVDRYFQKRNQNNT
jgi:hypothetical protein